MKIRMHTASAGPNGVRKSGHVYDVPDAEARELIKGNYAELAGGTEKATTGPGKTADRKPDENRDEAKGRRTKPIE